VEAGELVAATVVEGVTIGEAVTVVVDVVAVGVGLGAPDGAAHETRISAKAMRNRVTLPAYDDTWRARHARCDS
jgi:hypothetical protein